MGSLNKSLNLSSALQFKMSNLRSSTGLNDSTDVIAQAKGVADSLKNGNGALIDKEDIIETATPNLEAAKASVDLIDQKRSFYLGLPASWITGLSNKGLGDSGNADAKAVDRGLRPYFFSIIRPVVKALFGKDVTFKSEDVGFMSNAADLLRTFEGTSDEFISRENKTKVVNRAFNLPPDSKGDEPEATPTPKEREAIPVVPAPQE